MNTPSGDTSPISVVAGGKNESKECRQVDYSDTNKNVYEGELSPTGSNGGLQRRLGPRQIQLVAIGGSIGTGLYKGGPASLLLAFIIESCMVSMLNNCLAEMTTYMPVSGGFIRQAGT